MDHGCEEDRFEYHETYEGNEKEQSYSVVIYGYMLIKDCDRRGSVP